MQEKDRPKITLFSSEDAEAMTQRERVSSTGKYGRGSQTYYKVRESIDDATASQDLGIGSSRRLSVSPDVNNTFEEMFETDWEGYIWKQGHVVRSWRYRYAILCGTSFSYYVSKEAAMIDTEKFRGRVSVTGAKKDESRKNGVLITTTIGKVFAIYTKTAIESEIWIKMIQQAVQHVSGEKQSMSTGSLIAQTARSSFDWKNRNLTTVKQFYSIWTSLFLQEEDSSTRDTALTLISLFPLCSTDIVLTVKYPCEFLPASIFYGREGLVDVVLALSKFIQFKKFSVSRYLSTKQPNILQVQASGRIWNKSLQREFTFNTRDELQLSPGGRVLSMQMHIDVDLTAFQMSESDKKTAKSDRYVHASTSKRVLSLSIQHFHVNRVLGKGTFGTVVLAERKNTGEVFAVKILEKSSMSNYDKLRTKTEMRILRDVHHPFIAPLRFSFQSQSRVFLGMEYYPGGSLYTHMNRFSNNKEHRIKIPIDLSRVKFYAAQIVLALSHLHACDIVYRDLKPDNIMIDREGNIALVDFGLSKTSVGQLSGARTMAGSPAYTAPELLKPKRSRDYGKAVDWWCLGILIYEMLLAKRPFHHLNVSVLYKLIEKEPVKFPAKSSIPADAKSLILGLLEKDPMTRLGARQTSDVLTHPFFKDVKWDLVLKKRIQPPWVPAPLSIEEEKLKNPDIDFDKYLASKTSSNGNIFSMIFAWKSPHSSKTLKKSPPRDSDTFGKFSYVSDTTNSFLVDEDEMLDSAFTGRRSIQMQHLGGET